MASFFEHLARKFSLFSSDIGIDLGTATVLVYVKGKGVVLNEPSVVAVDKVTGKILSVGADAQKMADAMRDSSRELSQSYTSFVENISGGLSRTMGLFEENMHAVVSLLDGKLESIEKTAKTAQSAYTDKADRLNAGTDGLLSALSQLQRALGDMTRSVQAAGDALDEKADKEG